MPSTPRATPLRCGFQAVFYMHTLFFATDLSHLKFPADDVLQAVNFHRLYMYKNGYHNQ